MKITNLPASSSFGSADVLAIEINGKTYKLTGATLAAALESVGDYVTQSDMATTTKDGLMSATDKLKLNGIAAGAQVNSITGVKGNAEGSYRTGQVNLTPANIGAVNKAGDTMTGALARKVDVDFDTPPSAVEWTQIMPVTDTDNDIRGGVYMVRSADGSYQTIYGVRKDGVGWNYISPRINADDSYGYNVTSPAAFRSAIGLGNTQDGIALTSTDNTAAKIYAKLNALAISPNNGAGVPCYIANEPLMLLTGKTGMTVPFHGVITRTGTARFRIFGQYGDTGWLMYWGVDVTASAITPTAVYRLQGSTW